jgi:uncharacterized protein YacL
LFVEITRLFIVFLATAAGYELGRGSDALGGNGEIIGATLGACIGYVAGGVTGRLIRGAMGRVEARVEQAPVAKLGAGVFGAAAIGGLAALVGAPFVILVPPLGGLPFFGLLVWIGIYFGYRLASSKFEDLLAMAGLSTRPLVRAEAFGGGEADAVLVDTSAIIDGRLLAVARAGFLTDALLVPQFVLDELQSIADAQDPVRRRKGRRGLDMLEALQRQTGVGVHVVHDEVVEHDEIDAKLVALARRLRVGLITVDEPLQRVAELQGLRCLNLHRLADGLRTTHVPGELVRIPITREGKEAGQGVGFLDDGTMVVVGDAADLIGSEVEVRITSNVKTSLGNMLFASVAEVQA